MPSFSKFIRPEVVDRGHISERDLDIIEAILRYRFSPTSELVRLVGGNEDVTQRRLRMLWEWQVINRFAFPRQRTHSEFIYYLERSPLEVLCQNGRAMDVPEHMLDEIRFNREADYAGAALRGEHMKLGFLQHALMVSRMHYCLEMATRASGTMKLVSWQHGAVLAGRKVTVPKVRSVRSGNDYSWEELDSTERLPVEPDALFTLRFFDGRQSHFIFEADRGSMPPTDMLRKFRAYFHFIKRQQLHRDAFGVHPIRAVLVETTNESRGRKLMELVNHPLVGGSGRRAGLFWFTISTLLADRASDTNRRARYLDAPATVFEPIWALPDATMHALFDSENTAAA